jgi:hypothetical protein
MDTPKRLPLSEVTAPAYNPAGKDFYTARAAEARFGINRRRIWRDIPPTAWLHAANGNDTYPAYSEASLIKFAAKIAAAKQDAAGQVAA